MPRIEFEIIVDGGAMTLDLFTRGYVEAALWSSMDESTPSGGSPMDENYSLDDIAPESLAQMIEDCAKFQRDNAADLARARAPDYNGHDFWLTRNQHGVGFWDRDLGDVGERLTAAAHAFGECDLYIGDDGKVYA